MQCWLTDAVWSVEHSSRAFKHNLTNIYDTRSTRFIYITVHHLQRPTVHFNAFYFGNLMRFQVKQDIQQDTKKGWNLIYPSRIQQMEFSEKQLFRCKWNYYIQIQIWTFVLFKIMFTSARKGFECILKSLYENVGFSFRWDTFSKGIAHDEFVSEF